MDPSPAKVVENVPDTLATVIPPYKLIFPEGTANVSIINQKSWTQDQVSAILYMQGTVILMYVQVFNKSAGNYVLCAFTQKLVTS